mmetsp:Transcript_10426/g.15106  ORF Transcript_10426/g.15106 Transcript_10426/m.15106 type:complete len:152 (+) Transcript_10426:176-631(+)
MRTFWELRISEETQTSLPFTSKKCFENLVERANGRERSNLLKQTSRGLHVAIAGNLDDYFAQILAFEESKECFGSVAYTIDDVFFIFDLTFLKPEGEIRQSLWELFDVVEDDEPLHFGSRWNKVDVVGRSRAILCVIRGNCTAEHHSTASV